MRRLIAWVILLFSVGVAVAKQYDIDNIQMVHLLDKRRYVCNPEQILSSSVVSRLDDALSRLEDSTGIEVVVVAVDTLANHDCYETGIRLGQKYGVGKSSLNNGLVILLSTSDRCVQFVTGTGLEGYLTDVDCSRIQRRYMNDAFSAGRWNDGMEAGVLAVCEALRGSMTWEGDPEVDDPTLYIFLVFFLMVLMMSIYSSWESKKCPHCGKHKLSLDHTTKLRSDSSKAEFEDLFICKNCGESVKRSRVVYKANNRVRYNGGGRRGGGGFGGFGGGYSGGHFGGGHFGGGGAGSRF